MIQLRSVAPTFTRPNDATAYASGDLVANNTAAASVVPLVFPFEACAQDAICLKECQIFASGTGVASKALRLHLFLVQPTFTSAGDNGAISTVVVSGGAASGYLGSFDVTAMTAVSDGSFGVGAALAGQEVVAEFRRIRTDASNRNYVYGILEARGAYTPTAQETFTVSISGLPVGWAGDN